MSRGADAHAAPSTAGADPTRVAKRRRPPLLPRLLRLRHLRMASWQRVLFGDVPVAAGVLLAMADVASAWVVVALPASTLAMVKLHDVVAGQVSADAASRASKRSWRLTSAG